VSIIMLNRRCRDVPSTRVAEERKGWKGAFASSAGDYHLDLRSKAFTCAASVLGFTFRTGVVFLSPLDLAVLIHAYCFFERCATRSRF
jgi:hypothetical protein